MRIFFISAAFLLACVLVIAAQTRRRNTNASPSLPTLPIVGVCELVRNPERYHKKVVRLQATEEFGYHGSYIYDVCDGKTEYLSSSLDCRDEGSCNKLEEATRKDRRAHKEYGFVSRVGLVAIGKLYGPRTQNEPAMPGVLPETAVAMTTSEYGYGHLGSFEYAFNIVQIERTWAIPDNAPWSGSTEEDKIKQRIEELDFYWKRAEEDADINTLKRMLADEYIFIDDTGKSRNKTQHLEDAKKRDPELQIVGIDNIKVRHYGEVAVVTALMTKEFENKPPEKYRYTNVYVQRQGDWQIVSTQFTRITERQR